MADNVTEIRGMDELLAKMRQFPQKLRQMERVGMNASLLVLKENVPPYPSPPVDSTYRRTGTLGRTLGASSAKPDIYTVKGLGTNHVEGRFGTRLSYAPYIIGDQQARQNRHWWKLDSILPKAQEKIVKIWDGIMQQMAKFLDSKSSGVK